MKIAVIGTGHIGLVTAAALAASGHHVAGYDRDEEKILGLQRGNTPFYEPGLDGLLEESAGSSLSFTTFPAEALTGTEIVFICVGTPPRATGEANLIAVERAAREVARHAPPDAIIVEKSTVPAGTWQRVVSTLDLEFGGRSRFSVVSNPEFLREGHAVEDALNPHRILVGADRERAFTSMRKLYRPLIERGSRLIETDLQTAELAKHACNAFLAMKISYANALARICELSGADVARIAEVMGADPRIGPAYLDAGLGYGGYCFPKDLSAFEQLAGKVGYSFPLLREVARINDEALRAVVHKVHDALWNLEDKRIALLGLSFKPGTDDVRLSPPLLVATRLLNEGAEVAGYDPQAGAAAKSVVPGLQIATDPYDAAAGAHCLVVGTEWSEFRTLDLQRLKDSMRYPIIVDGRNMFDPEVMRSLGFAYYPTGRPQVRWQEARGA